MNQYFPDNQCIDKRSTTGQNRCMDFKVTMYEEVDMFPDAYFN